MLKTFYVQYVYYSGTSDSGPSEIETQYNRPLYTKDTGHRVPKIVFPNIFLTSE